MILTSRTNRRHATWFIASLVVVALTLFGVHAISSNTQTAAAVSGSEFNPGRIIDDSVFYNSSTLSAGQIQTFLNSKVPSCDTQGALPASAYGRSDLTRAEYASLRGWHAPPYTCLRDYIQNTPQMEAASGLCAAIPARASASGAQIIYDIATACGINPKVFAVLLEKEQSLVTDTWPLQGQYRNATGFACPDTAPCDPAYGGFFYQVYYAARQFKVYQKYPNNYNYRAGRTNTIYWNPDLSRCGSSQVYVENQATAALYIYTPYRPNAAALNNLYGTGDSCSSYGNRNFWRLFNDWFGSTLSTFTPVSNVYLSNGTYGFIGKGSGKALDVSGASKSDGAPLQIWDNNGSAAQRWEATRDSDNYYTLKNVNSGKVLDVANASTSTGAKVQIWSSNNTCAQKWAAMSVDGNITFLNKCSGLALDIASGGSDNGTKVQVWHGNYTNAQVWVPVVSSSGPIANGIYELRISSGLTMESAGDSTTNASAIQIGTKNNSTSEKWHVSRQPNGYYVIRNTVSGRVLDVEGASTANGTRIQLFNPNVSTCAQRWIIAGSDSQGYTLQSACSHKVLDVQNGAITTPETPVQLWDTNNTASQKWYFTRSTDALPNGTYALLTSAGTALDVMGGQLGNGTPVQLWTKNGSGAQSWRAEQQLGGAYTLVNPASGRYLDIQNAVFANGTRIQVWDGNGSCAQKWNIATRSDGKYEIMSACSNAWALDVAGGRIGSIGTTVQLWTKNGSGAQVWTLGAPW